MKEFNDTTRTADGEMKIPGRCSLSHLDIFAQQFRHHGQESFANPLYMSSDDGVASGRDAVTMATIPEVAAPHTSITFEITDTNKESEHKAAVIEVTSTSNGTTVECQNATESNEEDTTIEDVNRNEPDVTVGTKDTTKILPAEKKKKKAKKEKSRDKTTLEKVLKKLRDGDDGGVEETMSATKTGDEGDLSYRKYVRSEFV